MNKKALVFLIANLIFCSEFPIGGYDGNGDHGGHGGGNGGNSGDSSSTIITGPTLIDNFESGKNKNALGQPWFYFDDHVDGGTSLIKNSTINDDGTYSFTPSKSQGYAATYGGVLDYQFGLNQPVGCSGECPYGQLLAIGTMLAPDGKNLDASAVTKITFLARAKKPTTVRFEVCTDDVIDYGYHFTTLKIDTIWQKFSIDFSDLTQPAWAVETEFNPSKLTRIQWTVSADFNSPASGTIFLDDVYFDTNSTVIPNIPESYTVDDFEDSASSFNKLGFKWYYTDDSKDGGTSVITNTMRDVQYKYIYLPTPRIGYNTTGGGLIEYTFGTNKPIACNGQCEIGQHVSLSTDLGKPYNFLLVSYLHFKAKTSVPMKVTVKIKTSDVTDFGYHQKVIRTTSEWQEYTISLPDIAQPTWAIEQLLDPSNINGLEWSITADNDGTPTKGYLIIDDVVLD